MKENKTKFKKYKIGVVVIFVLALIIGFVICKNPKLKSDKTKRTLTMTTLNTGKSDCNIITVEDLVIVVDTAYEDRFNVIDEELKNQGITDIDYLILTHYDKDHIGGAVQLLQNYNVETILQPDYMLGTSTYENYCNYIIENNITPNTLTEDYIISGEKLGIDGLNIRVTPTQVSDYNESNNYSLITEIKYGDKSILMMGDSEKGRTNEYLESSPGYFDVIKIAHHGDYSKPVGKLLEQVTPKYAIITCEDETTVNKKIKNKLEEIDSKVFYNSNGKIVLETDGENLSVVQ